MPVVDCSTPEPGTNPSQEVSKAKLRPRRESEAALALQQQSLGKQRGERERVFQRLFL